MTIVTDVGAPAPGPAPAPSPAATRSDHRGSWIPTWGMITTRLMELRKRRGLMIALIAVNIGIPVVFLDRAPHLARGRSQVLRAGRRLQHLHHAGGRLHVRLRVRRGGRRRVHGGFDRPHGGDVPPPGDHRPVPVGALLRPHSGRARHRHRHGGGRLHHRLRRVRVRRADTAQLRRRQRPGRPLEAGSGHLGGGSRRPGHLQLQLPRRPGPEPTAAERDLRWAIDRAAAGYRHPDQGWRDVHRPRRRVAGPDPGLRGHGRQPGLRRLHSQLLVAVDLADGRGRTVDRTRGDHRLHRRASGSPR